MRSIFTILFIFIINSIGFAQQIQAIEYFFDVDPGFGNATSVSISAQATVEVQFTADVSNLTPGLHTLYVRAKDSNGQWSSLYHRPVLVDGQTQPKSISYVEYFFDTDPGFGNGTRLSTSIDSIATAMHTIVVNGLELGLHTLYFRARDNHGQWSSLYHRPVIVAPRISTDPIPGITAIEYRFLDSDETQHVNITPTPEFDGEVRLRIPSNLPLGTQTLVVQAKNEDGALSEPQYASFEHAANVPPSLSLSFSNPNPVKGDTLTAFIEIGNPNPVYDLRSIALLLNWNADSLIYVEDSVSKGDFLGDDPLFFANAIQNERKIDLSIGSKTSVGKSGTGILASLKFVTRMSGEVKFSFTGVKAEDINADSISISPIEKTISIADQVYTVVFQVDMNDAIQKQNFIPSEHVVTLSGIFNDWSTSADTLKDSSTTGVYEFTKNLPVGTYEFKYVYRTKQFESNAGGFEWDADPNRSISVTGNTTTGILTPTITFDDFRTAEAPTITSFTPTSGAVGTLVTITGTNFGATQGSSTVKIGTTVGTAISLESITWTNTEIKGTVPSSLTQGTYKLWVTINGTTVNSTTDFTVTVQSQAPTITSFTPTTGAVGTLVTITGTNFGATQGSSTVKIGTTEGTSISLESITWTNTEIKGTVPSSLTQGAYKLWVTINGTTVNSTTDFTVTVQSQAPTITSFTPTTGAVETEVTITGTNFGATQGSSTVKMGTTEGTSISLESITWTNTEIKGTVPSSLTEGAYKLWVTINGTTVNSTTDFTVTAQTQAPTITSFTPTSGLVGTEITISGTHFGATQGSSTVKIGTSEGLAVSLESIVWTDTQIKGTVPSSLGDGSFKIWIAINGTSISSALEFNVLLGPPTFTSVQPGAFVGESITIRGTNFYSSQQNSTVKIGETIESAIPITVSSWSTSEITAVLPSSISLGATKLFLSILTSTLERSIFLMQNVGINASSLTFNGQTPGSSTIEANRRPEISFTPSVTNRGYKTELLLDGSSVSHSLSSNEPPFFIIAELAYNSTYTFSVSVEYETTEIISTTPVTISFSTYDYPTSNSIGYSNSMSFSGTVDRSEFKLIGFNGSPQSISSLIGLPSDQFTVLRFNGSTFSSYTSAPEPGKGYWFMARQPVSISYNSDPVNLDGDMIEVVVNSGWNIISNPFEQDIVWDVNSFGGGQALYPYDFGWGSATTIMKAGQAYAWNNTGGVTVIQLNYYDLIVQSTAQKLQKKLVSKESSMLSMNEPETKFAIHVRFDGDELIRQSELSIISEKTPILIDKIQTPVPPSPAEGLFNQIVFTEMNSKADQQKLFLNKAIMEQDSGYCEPISIQVSKSGWVKIKDQITGAFDSSWKRIIADRETGRWFEMNALDTLSLKLSKGEHRFIYVIGPSEFINENLERFIPQEFALHQNYPNPFNPSTVISYSLPNEAQVRLEVYDVMGRRIAELSNGMQKAGYYQFDYDASRLASGVYLYRLTAGNQVQVRKMLLVK